MAFCPYYNLNCPHNDECEIWDASASTCGVKRQTSVLEMIMGSTGVHLHSDPPSGYHKVLNIYYDEATQEHVVIREDAPI